jgi:hypothetical protein
MTTQARKAAVADVRKGLGKLGGRVLIQAWGSLEFMVRSEGVGVDPA